MVEIERGVDEMSRRLGVLHASLADTSISKLIHRLSCLYVLESLRYSPSVECVFSRLKLTSVLPYSLCVCVSVCL